MKKILPIICLLLISKFNFGQSFALLDTNSNVIGSLIIIPVSANNTYQTSIKIKNLTGNNLSYKVDRVYLTAPLCAGNDVFFCAAGNCFPPDPMITFSSGVDNILANETLPSSSLNFGILADYVVGANSCSEDVLYKVYNANNPNDFVTVTLRYQAISGVNEELSGGSISNAFPNPSNSSIAIKYSVNAISNAGKIVLYDLLGKMVKDIPLENKQGVVKIDVSEINSGIYFYSFIVDEKVIQTKKIVVDRK